MDFLEKEHCIRQQRIQKQGTGESGWDWYNHHQCDEIGHKGRYYPNSNTVALAGSACRVLARIVCFTNESHGQFVRVAVQWLPSQEVGIGKTKGNPA